MRSLRLPRQIKKEINLTWIKKLQRKPNTDGLINCLPQPRTDLYPDQKVNFQNLVVIYGTQRSFFFLIISSKRYAFHHLPNFGAVPPAIYRDQYWAAGRRSGAVFFARYLDYSIVTRNLTAIYLDLVPSNSFTVTLGSSAIYRDQQKTRHRDADGN